MTPAGEAGLDLVEVWAVLADLASGDGPDGAAEVGRLARRALSDPLRLTVDEVATLAASVALRSGARPARAPRPTGHGPERAQGPT